jgi:branched-chain amino acid transport system substrate-binding protein
MQRSIGAHLASYAAVVFTCSALLGGCSGSNSSGSSSSASGTTAASGTVITIGADLPLSGGDASDGVPTKNGVLLAIKDANDQHLVPGFTIAADPRDDAVNGVHDPGQGAKNVQSLASDNTVLGIVGPFNSNVAQAEIPLSNTLGIALVSPANTNPDLTKGPKALQLRPQNPDSITYFRVCATDDVQGPVGADYAGLNLHLRKAYIVDDNETYGKGVADKWAGEFVADGGTILGRDHITKGQNDFHALLTRAAALHPDVVFFGGVTANGGGQLRKQMAGSELANVVMFGADGVRNAQFITDAGSTADQVYATVASVNADKIPAAQTFLKEYSTVYNAPVGSYSAAGYVSTMVIIKAIASLVKSNGGKMPSRADVLNQIRSEKKFDTIIGTFAFDANGDTTNKIISIYGAKKGAWVFLTQVLFKKH